MSAQYCRPTASLRCDSSQTLDIDFALHKLLVYGEREGGFAAKSSKDLHQSASLLAYYREHGTWDIDEAWADLVSRGKGWVRRALQGVKALGRAYPELGAEAGSRQRSRQTVPATPPVHGPNHPAT